MKLHNRKVSKNRYNQVIVTARLLTSKNWKLLNNANNGASPLDSKWNKNESIILPAGSWVDYTMLETHFCDYHTITYKNTKGTFSKTTLTHPIKEKDNK